MEKEPVITSILFKKYTHTPLHKAIMKNRFLYILLLPAFIVTFIFVYVPMPFLIVSIMDYNPFKKNIFDNPFIGLLNFKNIFIVPEFHNAVLNTFKLSALNLLIPLIAAVMFAIMLNEIRTIYFKRIVQTVSYLPFFLATISVIGISMSFLSIDGPLNNLIAHITGSNESKILFLSKNELFVPIAVIINLWKTLGWNSIIFLASIASIDDQLFEAAYIDGANRFKQIRYITIPGITPTVVMLLILTIGSLVQDNFDLVYGLQNPFMNYDVIQTVVFRSGITQGNFSAAAAFSLTQGIVGLVLTLFANKLSKTVSNISLF